MRIAAWLVLGMTVAGCSHGGSSAAPSSPTAAAPGVYRAVVTAQAVGGRVVHERIWYRVPQGSFRIRPLVADGRRLGPRLVVSSSGQAREVELIANRPVVSVIHGSPAFIAAHYQPVAVIASYLRGASAPAGVPLTVTRRGRSIVLTGRGADERDRIVLAARPRAVPTRLFQSPSGLVIRAEREVAITARAPTPFTAYWLGATWNGHAALRASADRQPGSDTPNGYDIVYPGLRVESTRALVGAPVGPARAIRLADGTQASLLVLPLRREGTFQATFSGPASHSGCPPNGGTCFDSSADIVMFDPWSGRTDSAGTAMALVITPTTMVSLSGPAVSPSSAGALARVLRRH